MLVGRQDELDAVRECLAEARPVVIVGPAGIGKSTLARAALRPIGAFREGGALATLAWAPLLVFRRLLGVDPPELAEEVADAVVGHGASPVLLDDLQWADDASLDVIARLVGRLPLIATVRSGEERGALVADAMVAAGCLRVDLDALGPGSAAELADALHPELGEAERAHLLAAADGNPLLLGELPRGDAAAPTLVSALFERVGSLGEDGRAAVERLAVLGRPTEVALLGPGAGELERSGLAFGSPARLPSGPDRLVMSHALLAEVIVEWMADRADEVRREMAPLVSQAEGSHLLAAAGDLPEARALALEAAQTGDRRHRASMLAFAVACAPDLDPGNRLQAARMFTSISEPAQARALCAVDGIEALDRVHRGALRAAEAEAAWLQGRHDETVDLVERALADLRGTRTAFEVAALAGSTVVQTFVDLDGRPALARAREAVRLADEIGAEQGYARSRLASVLMTSGEPGWAEQYQEVIELAVASDDDDLRRTAVVSLILGQWVTGDPAAAAEVARRELDNGPRQAFDVTWLSITSYAGVLGLVTGRPREALVAEFLPVLERWPSYRSRSFLESSVIIALADQGRHLEAASLATGSVERAGVEAQWRSIAMWAQIECAWLAGRGADAVALVGDLLALGVGDYPAAVQGRLVGGHAANELGMALIGPAPAALLPAWQSAPTEWRALVAAAEGRHGEAAEGFRAAADGWCGSDVRSEARCRWAAGASAAAAGDPDSIDLLQEAEDHAARYGLVASVDRIRRSLRSTGVVRRADRAVGAAGLTRREEQVLELVEGGMRTADIAAALGIEASTVESFVRSAMQKLGSGTRVAAATRWRGLRDAEAP